MFVKHQGDRTLPNLLLLHGFMGSSTDFSPAITTLSKHFHCICVDLPGHGHTQIDNHNFVSTANQILAIAPNQCHLLGYSLGGRLALYLALNHPDRWQKVILESTSFGLATPQARTQRQQQDAAIIGKLRQPELDFTAFIQNWYQQTVFTGIPQHPNFPELIASRLQNHPLALARSLETMGLGQQPYLGELLPTNQIPLLLLAGEQDLKFVAIGQQITQLCPQAAMVILPNCSHNTHFQQLELWLQKVLEFLL
jgi:2-succinyl-6-hydroxy-2,4-cyclohexadiene-1-carboxylate synthase